MQLTLDYGKQIRCRNASIKKQHFFKKPGSKVKKKILILTRNLPPLVGGMERLNWHMIDELSKKNEVRVICPKKSLPLLKGASRAYGVPLKPLWLFLLASLVKALYVCKAWKPDVIISGSGLTAPISLLSARVFHSKSVIYIHGLDIAIRHPIYNLIWIPAIRKADRIIANSSPTLEIAKGLDIPESKTSIVHPGVSLPKEVSKYDIGDYKNRHELENRPILISVGRFTKRKGLLEFLRDIMPIVVENKPNALLLILGEEPKEALHAEGQTKESLQEQANAAGVGKNIRFLGVVTDSNQLSCAYYSADVHVFPVQTIAGDPEGFGMVAIEAAAHGVPTVAYKTGGIVDAVCPGISGILVPPQEHKTFANGILECLEKQLNKEKITNFAASFSWQNFGEGIEEELNSTVLAHKKD